MPGQMLRNSIPSPLNLECPVPTKNNLAFLCQPLILICSSTNYQPEDIHEHESLRLFVYSLMQAMGDMQLTYTCFFPM